jgi:nudix-type nucleoside diphosphatase (YffH/AdpP family)
VKVKIIENKNLLNDYFKVDGVTLTHEKFDGSWTEPVRRLNLERGQAVAVLIYLQDKESFVLVRQFRYAVHATGEQGWIDEIVAGVLEHNNPLDCAKRECIEETGYDIDKFEKIGYVFASPGITTERVHLYIGYCNSSDKKYVGGGLPEEHEDILIKEISVKEAYQKLIKGGFSDGKTILALQHFFLKERGLI